MRVSFEEIYMNLAISLSQRATCKRLKVGCVITSADYQRVLAIGYNGNAAGLPNTCDGDEPGKCGCLHAENNATVKCADPYIDKIVFCTHLPCKSCAKLLINLGKVRKVFYAVEYRDTTGAGILRGVGIECHQIKVS